jgi:hypothetical protein
MEQATVPTEKHLTEACLEGYDNPSKITGGHLFSSDNWLAFKAGQHLNKKGMTRPISCKKSRGYRVRVHTPASEILVSFAGKDLSTVIADRL